MKSCFHSSYSLMSSYKRFLKYSGVGTLTFIFDLSLLYITIDFLHINYLIAAPFCFLIAVTINYYLSRKFVFSETSRSLKSGYVIFIGIALLSAIFIGFCMYFLTEQFHWPYYASRISIAAITGIWNYLLNLHLNFKVHRKV